MWTFQCAREEGIRTMTAATLTAPALAEDKELLISGSEAVAEALALADLDVVTAYPIRPYDTVMQAIAKKIANGQLVAEYIVAEGEHSQFEIVKHASTVGARVFCGSSGVGWAYAMECLVVTPPLRVPMVALVGNRALDDPGAFGVEHNDALFVRDLGWMLVWIDSSQEALDTTLIAYRVAEDRRVFLPLAISADGAFLTHSQAITLVPPREKVDRFLPPYNRGDLLLHPDNPITVAPQANEDWVIEIRRQNDEAMKRAPGVIEEAYADFGRIFGRAPENPWFEEYLTEDAEIILVGMGTISLPIKVAIREMRARGKKVGLVRLRWFRPFPTDRLVAALSRAAAVGVIDRNYSFGSPFASGVVANEIRAAMYNAERRPPLLSFISGLGGREVTLEDVYQATELCYGAAKSGKSDARTHWLGVRE
jgi:pyruvate ferredoxin oxidoreductase alpha subunit